MSTTNLIIAGVNKAGTTSLFSYLASHPDLCSSSIKETCYFLPLRYNKPIKSFETYQNYFKKCKGKKYLLESTPGYFYGGNILVNKVIEALPEIRIIISLRDPVDRLISFYRFKKNHLELPSEMTFAEYINNCKSYKKSDFIDQSLNIYFGLEGGKYIDYIDSWSKFYPNRIRFIDFEELKKSPEQCLSSICDWLSIDPSFYSSYEFSTHNKSVAIKNKGLQKLALTANKKFEKVFRENENFKKSLKAIYYKLNGKNAEEQIEPELILELKKYYQPFNQKLLMYFKDKKRDDIPNWLLEYETFATN